MERETHSVEAQIVVRRVPDKVPIRGFFVFFKALCYLAWTGYIFSEDEKKTIRNITLRILAVSIAVNTFKDSLVITVLPGQVCPSAGSTFTFGCFVYVGNLIAILLCGILEGILKN